MFWDTKRKQMPDLQPSQPLLVSSACLQNKQSAKQTGCSAPNHTKCALSGRVITRKGVIPSDYRSWNMEAPVWCHSS